jgi:PAS domain S-box-containing protein/putative nucleotidyltransferase with HDIG domain
MVKELEYISNILIVSIDPGISNVLGVLLSNLNYKIELINSGSDAFKELQENKFDLMLLDVILPDMSGIQILNYLKKVSPETLVIVMASEDLSNKAAECLKNGAYDCLKKPFRKEEILRRIENALEQRRLEKEIEGVSDLMQVTERRNQYLVLNSDDIVYTLDFDGKFTSISDSLRQKLGFDSNYLLRKHFSTVIYPEDIHKAMYVFNERRAVSRALNPSRIRLKKNGSGNSSDKLDNCITVEIKANGIYENQSNKRDKLFLGTYGIARDISDFMKNEELLRIQKTYFKELFSNSTNAAVLVDNDDKIINANKSFERLFKYSLNEIKNRYINDFLLRNDDPVHQEEDLGSSAFLEKESIGRRKDGTIINVMIYGYPIEYNSKNIGAYHIFRNITEMKRNDKELMSNLTKVRQSMGNISNAMVSTIEVRDPYTVGHQQRVSNLARTIACEMGLSSDDVDAIRMAGTLHDLGKVNIPAEILSKPGQLSKIEFDLIKMHPVIAYDILKKIDFPWPIADIVYQHHEKLDGSGYPQGLAGDDILLGSRILSVADVVESISSHRPYRPALGVRKALEEISNKKNKYYDSKVVDACIRLFNKKNFTFESDLPEENEYGTYRMPAYSMPN